jgi:hypothetical protein
VFQLVPFLVNQFQGGSRAEAGILYDLSVEQKLTYTAQATAIGAQIDDLKKSDAVGNANQIHRLERQLKMLDEAIDRVDKIWK